jgi:hypothetical protein
MILPPCRIRSGDSIDQPSEQILASLRNSVAPSKGNLRLIDYPLCHQLPPFAKPIDHGQSTVEIGRKGEAFGTAAIPSGM